MTSFAAAFKDEIRRLARKEVKAQVAPLKSASAAYRKEIAALKRTVQAQERQIRQLQKRGPAAITKEPTGKDVRFSPAWVAKHREKLEMSAADYGELIGVSMLTVYNWEKGKTRPRQAQLEAWGKIKHLGKREAWKLLEES